MSASRPEDSLGELPPYLLHTPYAEIWKSIRNKEGPMPFWVREAAMYRTTPAPLANKPSWATPRSHRSPNESPNRSPNRSPDGSPTPTTASLANLRPRESENEQTSRRSSVESVESGSSRMIGPSDDKPLITSKRRIPLDNPPRFEDPLNTTPPMPLPSAWRSMLEPDVPESTEIHCGDYEIEARADYSVPLSTGIYYYEVSLSGLTRESELTMGFTDAKSLGSQDRCHPEITWGWMVIEGSISVDRGPCRDYGRPAKDGDVVGCCFVRTRRQIFFTLNGKSLGVAFTNVNPELLYPAVFMDGNVAISTNFGQRDFKYNIEKVARKAHLLAKEAVEKRVRDALPVGEFSGHLGLKRAIAEYLLHTGFGKTAAVLNKQLSEDTEVSAAMPVDTHTEIRLQIRELIQAGDLDATEALLTENYPDLLKDEPGKRSIVAFELQCHRITNALLAGDTERALRVCRDLFSRYSDTESEPRIANGFKLMLELLASPPSAIPQSYRSDGRLELYELINGEILKQLGMGSEATLPKYLEQASRLMRIAAMEIPEFSLLRFDDYMHCEVDSPNVDMADVPDDLSDDLGSE